MLRSGFYLRERRDAVCLSVCPSARAAAASVTSFLNQPGCSGCDHTVTCFGVERDETLQGRFLHTAFQLLSLSPPPAGRRHHNTHLDKKKKG